MCPWVTVSRRRGSPGRARSGRGAGAYMTSECDRRGLSCRGLRNLPGRRFARAHQVSAAAERPRPSAAAGPARAACRAAEALPGRSVRRTPCGGSAGTGHRRARCRRGAQAERPQVLQGAVQPQAGAFGRVVWFTGWFWAVAIRPTARSSGFAVAIDAAGWLIRASTSTSIEAGLLTATRDSRNAQSRASSAPSSSSLTTASTRMPFSCPPAARVNLHASGSGLLPCRRIRSRPPCSPSWEGR
jgi:hypothetical protein